MNPREAIDQIPINGPPCLGKEIFLAWKRKELSNRDYYIQSAIQTAENVEKWYQPKPYFILNPTLRAYVDSRLSGARDYDYPLAKRLGDWCFQVIRCEDENSADVMHLTWVIEKCLEAGLENNAKRVTSRLLTYSNLRLPFLDFEDTMKVKNLDAYERERKK